MKLCMYYVGCPESFETVSITQESIEILLRNMAIYHEVLLKISEESGTYSFNNFSIGMSLFSEHFDVNNVTSLRIFKIFPSDLMPFRVPSSLFGTVI